jgi:hypothetical protein
VGGHGIGERDGGFLQLKHSATVLKPLQKDGRGMAEKLFYQTLYGGTDIPPPPPHTPNGSPKHDTASSASSVSSASSSSTASSTESKEEMALRRLRSFVPAFHGLRFEQSATATNGGFARDMFCL